MLIRITVGPQPNYLCIRYGCLMGKGLALRALSFFHKTTLEKYFANNSNEDFGIDFAVNPSCQIFFG